MEWSQYPVSGRSLAEFASRYPKPHLSLLIDAVTKEEKENILPPNFSDTAKAATERLERGEVGIDAALEDVMKGLTTLSAAELAVSTLGNLCSVGHVLPTFKEQIALYCDDIVGALCRQLRPLDWRLCGRAAGTVANVLRLGSNFVDAVQERCLEPLVTCLREESSDKGPMSMLHGLGADSSKLPFQKATSRLLGALVNFLVIRPAGQKQVRELGVLDIVVPLMESAAKATGGARGVSDEEPAVTASRALTLVSRLVRESPELMSIKMERDILQRVDRMLEHECRRVGSSHSTDEDSKLETLDLALRILTALVTRREGVIDRLSGRAPRVQELPEGADSIEDLNPAVPFGKLISRLIKLMTALKSQSHAKPDDEGTATSRIRGNLALLFGKLAEAQMDSDASPELKGLNLETLVDICIDWLRKERGPVQQNIGVCLTRLANNPQYRQRVRDLNGMESLHQIMLPKVEAQKAEASRIHRLKSERGLI